MSFNDPSLNESQTIDNHSDNVLPEMPIGHVRTQFIICNTSTTQKITIVKGKSSALVGKGIVLNPSGSYAESTDGGYKCYQGAIQAIADVDGGSISIVESQE